MIAIGPSRLALAGFQKQELAVPGGILGVVTGDFDGDGRTDLAVAYARGAGPRARRYLGVFFRGDAGYGSRPDIAFSAPRNAAVFDAGDAIGDEKDELVFLSSDGVYAQTFVDRKPKNPMKIVDVATLAGEPEEDDLAAWDFLGGIDDESRLGLSSGPSGPSGPSEAVPSERRRSILVVPTRRELRLYRCPDAAWTLWGAIGVQTFSYYDAATETYRRTRRGGGSGRQFSFQVTTVVPYVLLIDQTGDGLKDVVTHFEDRVAVFSQRDDGTLAEKPMFKRYFAVRTPAELETRDTSIEASVADLDRDGVADLVITKIGGGITTLATEVRIYRGERGGGFAAEPVQTFKDSGFGALVDFVDVDGDGRLEMLHPNSAVSVMSITRAMVASKVSLDVRIRRLADPPLFFDPRPQQTITSVLGLDLSVGATLRGGGPLFGYDFDGDGVRDVVLSEGGDKMTLHRGLGPNRGGDLFEDEGHVVLATEGTHKTQVLLPGRMGRTGSAGPDVLAYYVQRPELGGRLVVFRNTFEPRSTATKR